MNIVNESLLSNQSIQGLNKPNEVCFAMPDSQMQPKFPRTSKFHKN